MEAKYDLGELYQRAFGYTAAPYPEVLLEAIIPPTRRPVAQPYSSVRESGDGRHQAQPFNDLRLVKESKKVRGGNLSTASMLGAEIRMPMALKIPGTQNELFQLPNEPIVSIRGGKETVITSLNRGGKRGTVKEEVNLNDYEIAIRGLAINEQENDYPDQIIRQIRTLTEHPGSLEVVGFLFELFRINLVTVQDFYYPRDERMPIRVQAYEIKFISDEDFEIDFVKFGTE
jgi:hypothetical protein